MYGIVLGCCVSVICRADSVGVSCNPPTVATRVRIPVGALFPHHTHKPRNPHNPHNPHNPRNRLQTNLLTNTSLKHYHSNAHCVLPSHSLVHEQNTTTSLSTPNSVSNVSPIIRQIPLLIHCPSRFTPHARLVLRAHNTYRIT